MPKYIVTLNVGRMNLGGLGSARVQEQVSVQAADEAEAREKAKAEKPGHPIASVEQVFKFSITLRGHDDKRKRETFIMNSVSERDALRYLDRRYPQVWRFARYSGMSNKPERNTDLIVKITKEEM